MRKVEVHVVGDEEVEPPVAVIVDKSASGGPIAITSLEKETALFARADPLIAARKLDDAEQILQDWLRRKPDSAGALYRLGRVYFDRRDWARSASYLQQSLELKKAEALDPNVPSLYLELGLTYIGLKDAGDAQAAIEEEIRRHPGSAEAHLTLGELFLIVNHDYARAMVTGGKCNFWGRSSARFGDIDFKAASLDGFDTDWPVTYEEIATYYSRVEKWIGVASTVQNRPTNPNGEYLPPIPFRCVDYILQKGAEKLGVPYLPDRIAQLTVNHNGHPTCHYCGDCGSGCDTGSFFSPPWFTLPDGEKTGKLELRTNAIAKNVLVDENGRARGMAYIDCNSRQEVEVYSRAVVLAASCLETTHIMLNSKSRHWPTGIANSSGQLGRNLCDHL